MGLLGELSQRQEEFRGLVRDLYKDREGISDIDEDKVVLVGCTLFEMSRRDDEPTENDVLAAIEFLDHIGTLGGQVAWKEN